ncbi:MAG: endonuclease V [archaeon]
MKEEEASEKGICIEALKQEQRKLAKLVSLKDAFDFNLATRFAGIDIQVLEKEILVSIIVLDENFEVVDNKYARARARFPYIPNYRSFRELPIILEAYKKIEEIPDVIFIKAQGTTHPRLLGLASHLGISINKPVIGIVNSILFGEGEETIKILNKQVAKKIITKEKARPIYVSPGHLISLKSAVALTKKTTKEPHKLPEPLVEAKKYSDKIKKEFS